MTRRGFGTQAPPARPRGAQRVAPLSVGVDAIERGIARRSRRVVAPALGRRRCCPLRMLVQRGVDVAARRRPRRGARHRPRGARPAHDAAEPGARGTSEAPTAGTAVRPPRASPSSGGPGRGGAGRGAAAAAGHAPAPGPPSWPARRLDARLLELTVRTPALAAETRVRVLLPTGYADAPPAALPGALPAARRERRRRRLDALRRRRAATAGKPLIVVMPDGGRGGWYTNWYKDGEGGPPAWETYHVDQLVAARRPAVPHRRRAARPGDRRPLHGRLRRAQLRGAPPRPLRRRGELLRRSRPRGAGHGPRRRPGRGRRDGRPGRRPRRARSSATSRPRASAGAATTRPTWPSTCAASG